ncbi:hypothetical protein LCGC14_2045930 [marine sediment metagenome]|uniref:Uncharacterized protein n=1 Tax=marine sediment metagenome TaxID=412755 RepID=A0A0F9HMG3_9ZZZZ
MAMRAKDKYPQILSVDLTATAADITTILQIPLPVARVPGTRKVTVFEILKIQFTQANSNALPIAANTSMYMSLSTVRDPNGGVASTNAQILANIRDPRTFAHHWLIVELITSGAIAVHQPYELNFEDSNGRGILVATDSIFLTNMSIALTVVNNVFAKIFYRFVDVNPIEFIGIVQSQQG